MCTIQDAAKYFVWKGKGDVTHLKLQKLLYYAQAWHLALNSGAPLFKDRFEAWAHGPVNPIIFSEYREHGWNSIPVPKSYDSQNHLDPKVINFLDEVWRTYGSFDARALENMTHREKPWLDARAGYGDGEYCTNLIDEKTMESYYSARLQ